MENRPAFCDSCQSPLHAHALSCCERAASGNIVASYSYDEFGAPLSSSESFPGGWTNPYRYDGRDLVRYDSETSLDWMSVRAYDPTLGRFISRDPLGRAPLMGWTSQPYAYAGNNPLVNVDPSGQRLVGADGAVTETAAQHRSAYRTYIRNVRISCRFSKIAACYNYRGWMEVAAGDRDRNLLPLFLAGSGMIVFGFGLKLAADLETLRQAGGVVTSLKTFKTILLEFAKDLLPFLGMVAAKFLPWVAPILSGLAALIHGVQALVNAAIGFAKLIWGVGLYAAGKLLTVAKAILGGVPDLIVTVAEQLAGSAGAQLLRGAGQGAESIGWGMLTQYNIEEAEGIWDWCAQHRGVCPPQPSQWVNA